MSDTIFFTLKLKRTKTPLELFEKMQKCVKPKGITKNWVSETGENGEYFSIDFNDGRQSETLFLEFDDKKVCDGFCKVLFPLDGEQFDNDKKSEFKALLNMFYSARTFFSQMDITDDYGLCESFFESKKYRIVFRELTDEEMTRTRWLFEEGHTDLKEFIIALLLNLRGLHYDADFKQFINMKAPSAQFIKNYEKTDYEQDLFTVFVDSFLYETTKYQNKGLLREIADYFGELNGVWFSAIVFQVGITHLINPCYFEKAMDPKSAQVFKLYDHSFAPLFQTETDDLNKCILAYRYFVSIYDWLGFRYAG